MSDLREQLAKRMWEIDPRRWPGKPDLIISGFANTDLRGAGGLSYGNIADECIRQMEWARRNCLYGPSEIPGGSAICLTFNPISIAPEDWKP